MDRYIEFNEGEGFSDADGDRFRQAWLGVGGAGMGESERGPARAADTALFSHGHCSRRTRGARPNEQRECEAEMGGALRVSWRFPRGSALR